MSEKRKMCIVSPHCDDSVLSLGGLLAQKKNKKKIIVVFNKSDFAPYTDVHGNEKLVTVLRMNEERQMASEVGAKLVFLHKKEGNLRGLPANHEILLSREKNLIRSLTKKIKKHIRQYNVFFFPAAIGWHIDHIVCFDVLCALLKKSLLKNRNFFLYEDLPYAFQKRKRIKRKKEIEELFCLKEKKIRFLKRFFNQTKSVSNICITVPLTGCTKT
jgi:LmbE family N-acetylglucosaminyl deacetylase